MSTQFFTLCDINNDWTDREIDTLLKTLKRDRSFTPNELSNFIRTKNVTQVRELLSCLVEVDENELLEPGDAAPKSKPEGSIDILIQSTGHCITRQYDHSLSIGELLNDLGKSGSDQFYTTMKEYVSYSQLYQFLSTLFTGQKLPPLSDFSSGVLLDFLTCLVRFLNLIHNRMTQSENEDNELNKNLKKQWEYASQLTVKKIGVYLACSAAMHFLTRQHDHFGTKQSTSPSENPVAPLFLLADVPLPKGIAAIRSLLRCLTKQFTELWSLPKMSSPQVGVDFSEASLPHSFYKRMTMFSLNPLLFSMDTMKPFQEVLNEFRVLVSTRSLFFKRLQPILYKSLNNPKTTGSGKRSKSPKLVQQNKRIKSATGHENLNVGAFITESLLNTKASANNISPTNQWKISNFYVRIADQAEEEAVRNKLLKCLQVKTKRIRPGRSNQS